jgi:hypothetical protein
MGSDPHAAHLLTTYRTDAACEALERVGGVTDSEWEVAKAIALTRGATGQDVYREAGDICLYEPGLVFVEGESFVEAEGWLAPDSSQ